MRQTDENLTTTRTLDQPSDSPSVNTVKEKLAKSAPTESVATQLYVPSSERVTGHSSSVDSVKLLPPAVIGSVYTVATLEELVTGSEFLNQVMSG